MHFSYITSIVFKLGPYYKQGNTNMQTISASHQMKPTISTETMQLDIYTKTKQLSFILTELATDLMSSI